MTFKYEPRVWQETTTTGNGNLSLSDSTVQTALSDFVSAGFSTSGQQTHYMVHNREQDEYEWGMGYVTSGSPDVLVRSKVYRSSNSNSKVSFSAGTKDVFLFHFPGFYASQQLTDTSYTFAADDEYVKMQETTAATRTYTLPLADDFPGKRIYIAFAGAAGSKLTITRSGSDLIKARGPTSSATSIDLFPVGDSGSVGLDSVGLISIGGNSEWAVFEDTRVPHTARISRNAAQSIPNATLTKIAFDTEDFDVGDIGDVATNDRIDIRRDGRYLINAQVSFSFGGTMANAAGYLAVNGSIVMDRAEVPRSGDFMVPFSMVYDLNSGDYVELKCYQDTGGSVNTLTSNGRNCRLAVTEIR